MAKDKTQSPFDEFMQDVAEAAKRVGVTNHYELAMCLAMCEQESRGIQDPNHPTLLALVHNNLFGIKWIDGDEAKGYKKVTYHGNEFDGQEQVSYREYKSQEHCIYNWRWHIEKSSHFEGARRTIARLRVRELAGVWCSVNPQHVHDVEVLYNKWLEELE